MTKQPKILFYDIETAPLQAWIWGLGDQVVRHDQLVKNHDQYNIICITYCWNDGKAVKSLDWGYNKQNSKTMIARFDQLVKKADICIGKNSDKFDVKHINTQRLLHNLPPMPEWMQSKDDLEKQLRKHFHFPSQSLDYIAKALLGEGKIKMERQDWIDIVERNENGMKALRKMIKYGKRDTKHTRDIWNKVKYHIQPKFNMATFKQEHCCTNCGSNNVKKNGTRIAGKQIYQHWYCVDHGGYAGRTVLGSNNKYGKMMG